MKVNIDHINKVFESRVRLGVMSILMVNEQVDFNTLKELLNLTDGNLSSHISSLEKSKYINVNKRFVGKKPKTSYMATEEGRIAFQQHLKALEELIKMQSGK